MKYQKTNKFNNLNFLKQFKNCCIYTLNKYNQVNKELEIFITEHNLNNKNFNNFDNVIQSKTFDIAKDKRFNQNHAPELLNDVYSGASDAIYIEMIINIICYSVLYDNWIIKEVDNDLCLLIPKKYLDNLSIEHKDVRYKNHKNRLKNKLTQLELKFGLKVNHLRDLDLKNLLNNQNLNSAYGFDIIDSCKNLFVHKKYSKDVIWSLYCSGHGFYESFEKIFLPQLQKLKEYYEDKLQNKISNKKQQHEYAGNLDFINHEIEKLESLEEIPTVNNIDLAKGIILSMQKEDFKKLLLFFNDNIETAFLYYTSCYSGGSNLIEPYVQDYNAKNIIPLIFNYNIVSGTICENMSMQLMPIMHIAPYYHLNNKINISKNSIDFKNKKLKLRSPLKFKKYFRKLRTQNYESPEILKNIINNYLHPYNRSTKHNIQLELICNTPLIRFKNTNYFQVTPFKYDNISIINPQNKLNNSLDNLDKEVNLLYTDYVPKTVNMGKDSKAIVSMLPGFAGHVFESISAPDLELKEVIKPFLYFEDMAAPKVFWIKKLKCKDINKLINTKQDTILNNVIIIRNIVNTNKLKDLNNKIKEPTTAYIYFDHNNSTDSFYKIRWPKFSSNDINIKNQITLCNSELELQNYKNEILALKPDLQSYFKDTRNKFA